MLLFSELSKQLKITRTNEKAMLNSIMVKDKKSIEFNQIHSMTYQIKAFEIHKTKLKMRRN